MAKPKPDRTEYMAAYYRANLPTEAEKVLLSEANRDKRKLWNKTARANLKAKRGSN